MATNKEAEFYSETEIINSTRALTASIILLFLSFTLLDLWSVTAPQTKVLFVRTFVVFCLLISFLMTYIPRFYQYMNIIMPGIIIVSTLAIEYMIYKSSPGDRSYSIYFVSLVLMVMTLYSWTYIKFSSSLIISYVIVSVYIYVEKFTRIESSALSFFEILAYLSIIASAIVIGVVARLMRDRIIYKNVMLKDSLAEALQAMTEEAKDNAHLANHDELTGLPNRRYVIELLEKSLEYAKTNNKVLVIMFIDLNGFKQINDEYGHAIGDKVLTIVARRLEFTIRKSDCLSRLGGDEYLLGLLMNNENYPEAESMAEKFSTIISEPMNIDGIKMRVGASIGIAAYPMHGDDITTLMDIADNEMYQDKKVKKAHRPESVRQLRFNEQAIDSIAV